MAYDSKQVYLVDQGGGFAAQSWIVNTADSPGTYLAANYISNAQALGIKPGDEIEFRQFTDTTFATFSGRQKVNVGTVTSSGATLVANPDKTVAVTATSDGLTTGIIPDSAEVVDVTPVSSSNFVTLPTAVKGKVVTIINNSGTAFKLRTPTPTTISINGGTGSNVSTTLASTALVAIARAISSTQWIVNSHVAAGTESAAAAAA